MPTEQNYMIKTKRKHLHLRISRSFCHELQPPERLHCREGKKIDALVNCFGYSKL